MNSLFTVLWPIWASIKFLCLNLVELVYVNGLTRQEKLIDKSGTSQAYDASIWWLMFFATLVALRLGKPLINFHTDTYPQVTVKAVPLEPLDAHVSNKRKLNIYNATERMPPFIAPT